MNIGAAFSARRLKQISSLSRRKYREEYGQSVIEGLRSVRSAAEAGADILEILATREALDEHGDAIKSFAGKQAPVYIMSAKDFGRLSNVENAQGILAVVRTRWSSLPELASLGRVVALDGVQDPGNVGSIIRTAAWFGIGGILAGPGTADIFGPKVLRASMGGLWDVSVARCKDLPVALEAFVEQGHRLTAADLGGTDVDDWTPAVPATLVVGNEGSGISAEVRKMVHDVATIFPGREVRGAESLNVSVAAAIIMHHWSGYGGIS